MNWKLIDNALHYDEDCESCNGDGQVIGNGDSESVTGDCIKCKGDGRVSVPVTPKEPTEDGLREEYPTYDSDTIRRFYVNQKDVHDKQLSYIKEITNTLTSMRGWKSYLCDDKECEDSACIEVREKIEEDNESLSFYEVKNKLIEKRAHTHG